MRRYYLPEGTALTAHSVPLVIRNGKAELVEPDFSQYGAEIEWWDGEESHLIEWDEDGRVYVEADDDVYEELTREED